MSTDDLDRLEEAIVSAGADDYLDYWCIGRIAATQLGPKPPGDTRELVLQAIRHLVLVGKLRVGELVPPGEFVAWPVDAATALAQVEERVRQLDGAPQPSEVAYFEVPDRVPSDGRAMTADITIEVRFRTTEEGGRAGPVFGKEFGCPMFIGGEAFDCRLLIEGRVLELGKTYEVPVRFLSANLALPKLASGSQITLWEGKEIAEGKVLRFGP